MFGIIIIIIIIILILNRIIFICFAEDQGLLPSQILEENINYRIENRSLRFDRCTIWNEVNYLFEDIKKENKKRKVTGYNGTLFDKNLNNLTILDLYSSDSIFDDLKQSYTITNDSVSNIIKPYQNSHDGFINPIYKNILLLASFNYNTEIDINILGHIFEQSLTDLEELHESLNIEEKSEKSRNLRKREGIYYTPKFITEYICQKTIIPYLSEENSTTVTELVEEFEENLDILETKLSKIKILDMACGSGAFLNMALQTLTEIHKLIYIKRTGIRMNNHNLENSDENKLVKFTRERNFDIISTEVKRKIALNNLYGVDKNEESVGITKLSLFLQTAEKDNALPDLSFNILNGNSILDNKDGNLNSDLEEEFIFFNWNEEFSEILQDGGFDIIIGNPPYIRREKINDNYKQILEKKFQVYHGNADLYCYFYERGLELLKKNGLLGFITSNKWMKTDYGDRLRYFLFKYKIEEIIDFFELNVFEDASTEPAIIILKKSKKSNSDIKVTMMETLEFNDFREYIRNNQFAFNQEDLKEEPQEDFEKVESMNTWNLSNPLAKTILEKMNENAISLSDYVGNDNIKMGIKPERIDIFRITEDEKNKLIERHISSKKIIRPFIQGTEIRRYAYEHKGLYFILAKGGINIDDFPAIKNYFSQNRESLESRYSVKKGRSNWYELRPCDYYDKFENEKIIYIHTAKKHKFAMDDQNYYIANNCYLISSSDKYLLAFLNSKLFEFYKKNKFVSFGNPKTTGRCKLDHNKMKEVPIKTINNKQQSLFIQLVDKITPLTKDFIDKKQNFVEFVSNNYNIDHVSNKLEEFWKLNNQEFLDEVKKYTTNLTATDLEELYELFINKMNNEIKPLRSKINNLDKEINDMIFDVFEITQNQRDFINNYLNFSG